MPNNFVIGSRCMRGGLPPSRGRVVVRSCLSNDLESSVGVFSRTLSDIEKYNKQASALVKDVCVRFLFSSSLQVTLGPKYLVLELDP